MFLADQPAVVAPSEQPALIEVVGTRGDRAQKIDRRTYRVRQGPDSAQADTLQLLRGLPAVIVTPDDQILLLGSGNVRILVDERPVRGNVTQYLRTLRGSDIERIEIITNPSAQFASEGTGGIVNIVLRRQQRSGLSGSASAEVTSVGNGLASATLKRKRGAWTTEVQVQASGGEDGDSRYSKLRTVALADGQVETNSEAGQSASRRAASSLSAKLAYELDPKTTLSTGVFGGFARSTSRGEVEFRQVAGDFTPFTETQRTTDDHNYAGVDFAFDRRGRREGESLKASANIYGNPESDTTFRSNYGDGSGYEIRRGGRLVFADAKVDWTRPFGTSRILSLGSSLKHENSKRTYAFEATGADGRPGPEASESFTATDTLIAGYATFQQRIGDWTFMPGLRIESTSREVSSPGYPTVETNRTALFPSFHLERPLGERMTMTWSYSRRIDRPYTDDLRPFPILTGGLGASLGNPYLRDQTTDAFEVNLHYRYKTLDAGVIAYSRATDDLWSRRYFVDDDGLSVQMPVNAGSKIDRGAQFDVSTQILRRLKGMASINLFDSKVPLDPLLSDDHARLFRYSGNATLEWRGRTRGETPGDIAQVQLTYESPARVYQIRYDERYSLNLSWTHSLDPKWAITGQLNGIGAARSRHRLLAPTVQEEYRRWNQVPVLKIKLVRVIGDAG